MADERPPTQKSLTDLPLELTDRRLWVDHVFPFVDRHWRVAFFLLDAGGAGPWVFRETIEPRAPGLRSHASSAALLPLGVVPLEELAGLVHFDPWWVLRRPPGWAAPPSGFGSPDALWLEAYKATNIAVRFTLDARRYSVSDLVFEPGLRQLASVEARASLGRIRILRYGDLDLTRLRLPAPSPGSTVIRST